MTRAYHARVVGAGFTAESFPIERETDGEAIEVAFAASSPFGHSLWDGRRFLGYFEAGDGREPRLGPVAHRVAAIPRLPC